MPKFNLSRPLTPWEKRSTINEVHRLSGQAVLVGEQAEEALWRLSELVRRGSSEKSTRRERKVHETVVHCLVEALRDPPGVLRLKIDGVALGHYVAKNSQAGALAIYSRFPDLWKIESEYDTEGLETMLMPVSEWMPVASDIATSRMGLLLYERAWCGNDLKDWTLIGENILTTGIGEIYHEMHSSKTGAGSRLVIATWEETIKNILNHDPLFVKALEEHMLALVGGSPWTMATDDFGMRLVSVVIANATIAARLLQEHVEHVSPEAKSAMERLLRN